MVGTVIKSSEETLTEDEKQVLSILEQNAKESIDRIAKKCGFSRQKVWRIVKLLEENQTIWGYTTITDGKKKDLKHFTLLVKRSTLPFDESLQKEIIYEKLDNYLPPGVIIENISSIHGYYDVIVTFYAPDLLTAKKVPVEIIQRLKRYIEEYLLCETLFPIRKNGFKNPHIKNLIDFL